MAVGAQAGQVKQREALLAEVVVLDGRGAEHLEEVQGQGLGVEVLDGQQVRGSGEAGEGQQVVVVDEEGAGCMEAVRGERGGLVVLEGQRLRGREVRARCLRRLWLSRVALACCMVGMWFWLF